MVIPLFLSWTWAGGYGVDGGCVCSMLDDTAWFRRLPLCVSSTLDDTAWSPQVGGRAYLFFASFSVHFFLFI